jgi:hypothetical protein
MAVKNTKSKQGCNYGDDCPPGQWCNNGTCVPQKKSPGTFSGPSVKVAGAILGSAGAAIGTYLSAGKRDDRKKEKEAKKKVDDTAKKITSNVMKKGGMIKKIAAVKKISPVKKRTATKKK